jgi:cation transport ATPase
MLYWVNLLIDWFALPSLVLLAGVLLYRKQHKEFPLFFSYVIVTILVGVIRLAAQAAPTIVYRYTYWISDLVSVAFAFLATYELFIKRLFPGFYKVRFFRYLFPAVASVITLIVVCVALYGNHNRVLLLTARIYEFLRAATLFFFVALMTMLGRRWEKKEFGIAFGFGLDVAFSLASIALASQSLGSIANWVHTGNRNALLLNTLPVVAYDIACIVWLYCFWTTRETSTAPPISPEALAEAKKWEDSLKGFVHHGKR